MPFGGGRGVLPFGGRGVGGGRGVLPFGGRGVLPFGGRGVLPTGGWGIRGGSIELLVGELGEEVADAEGLLLRRWGIGRRLSGREEAAGLAAAEEDAEEAGQVRRVLIRLVRVELGPEETVDLAEAAKAAEALAVEEVAALLLPEGVEAVEVAGDGALGDAEAGGDDGVGEAANVEAIDAEQALAGLRVMSPRVRAGHRPTFPGSAGGKKSPGRAHQMVGRSRGGSR